MLVLARKVNEEIVIGDGIRVTVLSVKGNRVRLGIEAPDRVRVLRAELQRADGAERPSVGGMVLESSLGGCAPLAHAS